MKIVPKSKHSLITQGVDAKMQSLARWSFKTAISFLRASNPRRSRAPDCAPQLGGRLSHQTVPPSWGACQQCGVQGEA